MADLLAKLKAAIDEDERLALNAALKAGGGEWAGNEYGVETNEDDIVFQGESYGRAYPRLEAEYGDHIARHDPARVLRQVAAYRALAETHITTDAAFPHLADPARPDRSCIGCALGNDETPITSDVSECPVLLALAAIYGIGTDGHG